MKASTYFQKMLKGNALNSMDFPLTKDSVDRPQTGARHLDDILFVSGGVS